MPEGLSFDEIYHTLPNRLETAHFDIRYGPYEVVGSRQSGYRGFRGMSLVTAYADGLEAGFSSLQKNVFTQTTPIHPIQVAICHLQDYIGGRRNEPITIPAAKGPRILLSNRSCEISLSARLDRARCEATHEVCHVFQLQSRQPSNDVKRGSWAWINEATAVFSEQFVHKGGAESSFYCQEWLDSPEVPLDYQSYSSSMFVRWYAGRFGIDQVGKVWEHAHPKETPLDVIERLSARHINEIFTEYARDAYFLCDSNSKCFFPDIQALWGFREIRKKWFLPADSGESFKGQVNHLAAGYFEVRAHAGVSKVRCTLEFESSTPALRAQIAEVKSNLHKGVVAELERNHKGALTAQLGYSEDHDTDHYVVVISNGTRDLDKVAFSLTIADIS
jgi:hypothetical protein